MNNAAKKNYLLFLIFIITVYGCAVGPDYTVPENSVNSKQIISKYPFIKASNATSVDLWWSVFDDQRLSGLIKKAKDNNLDVKIAVARIKEARAYIGIERASWFPSINAEGSVSRSRQSEDISYLARGDYTTYYTGLDASWELDLFGRIRRSVEAAVADYAAMEELRNNVLVTLCADVATTYFNILTFQARLQTMLKNIDSQKATLELTEIRYKYGIATYLDVAQARQVLADTEAGLPSIKSSLVESVNSLSVLLGEAPGPLVETFSSDMKGDITVTLPPDDITIGIPADSVRNRPDVRQAERELAAQTARIGVATADLYPSFSLTGTFGFNALKSANLFNASSRAYGFGPSFQWNLFDMGSIRKQIRVEDARTEQALRQYELTLLQAVKEVHDSLVGYYEQKKRLEAVRRSVEAAMETFEMALRLYKDGLTDFQDVLDAQRSLLDAEDSLDVAMGNTSIKLVNLYKSLGGGWKREEDI